MVYKYAGLALLVFGWLYASVYLFNQFNAWCGIGLFVVGLVITADRIYKKIIKNNN
ncbi:hypothetical protein [Flavobacterium sp.]|uniref:hypothetical protein n=1 Tax=Flavobacterium sp. TaxID=239 RepID=UPI002615289A|nr:hypothetical protein [Flavobacterium sp.]